MTKSQHKRRIKLIKPGLQLKLIGAFVGLSALSFLMQALVLARFVSAAATELPEGGTVLMTIVPSLLREVLIFSFGLCLPLTFAVGVLVTFRIAGPIYRFERFFEELARGEARGPCCIRQGDQLQELCEKINAATEPLWSGGAGTGGPGAGDGPNGAPEADAAESLRRAG